MTSLLDKLPTILVLFVLVGIFLSLRKHAPSARTRLWVYAWALIFLHFFIQAFETHTGALEQILESIELGALELSGMVFVVSMTQAVENRKKRRTMLLALRCPTAFHAVAATFDWHIYALMAAALGADFPRRRSFRAARASASQALHDRHRARCLRLPRCGHVHDQLHGSADLGVNAILTLSFGLCGILFWKRFPRRSTGVLAVSGGFLAWGAVFPTGALLDQIAPKLQMNPELWNVPKFFVAFGMILALIEEKSRDIEQSRERERAANKLLVQLSQITSRLLAGSDPASLAGEVTAAVTGASSFQRAALFLAGEDRTLRLSGMTGFSPKQRARFEERSAGWTVEKLRELARQGEQLGDKSFRVTLPAEFGARDPEPETIVLIPLVSGRGAQLGCLCLGGSSLPAASERRVATPPKS